MSNEEKERITSELDAKMAQLSWDKGADYATVDTLSNFKRMSQAAKILGIDVHTTVGYSMFMVLLKMDRITNLLTSGKLPSNESIEDSFMDGICYFKLAYLNYTESVDNMKG